MNIDNFVTTDKATSRPVCIDLPDTESVASFFDNLVRWLSEGHRLLLIDTDAFKTQKDKWLKGYTKSCRIFITQSVQAFDSRGYQCHRYQIGKGQLDYVPLPVEFDEHDLNTLTRNLLAEDIASADAIILDDLTGFIKNYKVEKLDNNLIADISALYPIAAQTKLPWLVLNRP